MKKARMNMKASWLMEAQSGHMSVKAAVRISLALVRSVKEYGSEVWVDENWEEAEKLQRKIGRIILGMKNSTNHCSVGHRLPKDILGVLIIFENLPVSRSGPYLQVFLT